MCSQSTAQVVAQVDSQPVYFTYHVPKCAGRTIDRHLATSLPPGAYFRVKKRRGLGQFLGPGYDLSVMPHPDGLKALGGHFLGLSIESLFGRRPVKRSILLRDPASHIVSYYNFRMARYLSQGLRPYSFEVAYAATRRNFITHYILSNLLEMSWWQIARLSDEDKYDVANALLASFWYVGDYRLCDNLVASLGGALSISGQAIVRNRQSEWAGCGWKTLSLHDLPASVVDGIRRENFLDRRLWETWRDAGHDTRSVRPLPLTGRSSAGFIGSEATRFVYQLVRRAQRRWGYSDGSLVPGPLAGLPR